MDNDPEFDLNNWTSRLLAGMLEFTILYVLQHYQDDHYPDTIKKKLVAVDSVWEGIKTPTLYSTIKRMEEYKFIIGDHVIVNSKLKKKITLTDKGRDLLPILRNNLNHALKAFKFDDALISGVK